MTIFYEGEQVEWVGGDFKATGHIVSLGNSAAHVKWETGPDADNITFIDLYDIEPVTAVKRNEDPMHLVAVRRAYDEGKEIGVLNFLANNEYLENWTKIAQDILAYAEDRIRGDVRSMELVDEQLSLPERDAFIKAGALALLRDAFSDEEE